MKKQKTQVIDCEDCINKVAREKAEAFKKGCVKGWMILAKFVGMTCLILLIGYSPFAAYRYAKAQLVELIHEEATYAESNMMTVGDLEDEYRRGYIAGASIGKAISELSADDIRLESRVEKLEGAEEANTYTDSDVLLDYGEYVTIRKTEAKPDDEGATK